MMQQATILLYDGTFDGLLSCVFEIYESRISNPVIKKENEFQDELFGKHHNIISNHENAKRVWFGIKKLIKSNGCNILYYSFLSEITGIENIVFNVIKYAFDTQQNIISDFSDPDILKLSKTARKVGREKHRMEAFVRFQQTKDGIYFSKIEPDFNVLPLINTHFTTRYADQKWIIYDVKRKYGLFYDLNKTEVITIDFHINSIKKELFTTEENQYELLWKNYFKSTNIEERINTALHVKHVPKRYWKYLNEKQP